MLQTNDVYHSDPRQIANTYDCLQAMKKLLHMYAVAYRLADAEWTARYEEEMRVIDNVKFKSGHVGKCYHTYTLSVGPL